MANVKKIDWTFIDYLTFINAVVNETIKNGIEYKRFYITLTAASMFYSYEPEVDENGNFNMNDVWNDIHDFKDIKTEDNIKVFPGGLDLYKLFGNTMFLSNEQIDVLDAILPIDMSIFEEMLDVIDEKIEMYKNKDEIKESVTRLINSIAEFVDNTKDTFEGVDLKEITNKMDTFSKTMKENDFGVVANELATIIHNENKTDKKA